MFISNEKLAGLKVETRGGKKLGVIDNFDIQTEGQTVSKYYVKAKGIKGLVEDRLIIDREQVISIDGSRMIVDDNIIAVETKLAAAIKSETGGLAAPALNSTLAEE